MSRQKLKPASHGKILPSDDAKRLLQAVPKRQPAPAIHLIKAGLSKALAGYKVRSGKTMKTIGKEIGLSESVVSRMMNSIDSFTIDFFVDRLSRIEDSTVEEYMNGMIDHSFLWEPNPFAPPKTNVKFYGYLNESAENSFGGIFSLDQEKSRYSLLYVFPAIPFPNISQQPNGSFEISSVEERSMEQRTSLERATLDRCFR